MTDESDEGKKAVQKWRKKYPKGKGKPGETVLIYPHYHCIYCNSMIDKNEDHETKNIQDKSYPAPDHICSQCSMKREASEAAKPWYKRMKVLMLIGIIAAVIIVIIVVGMILTNPALNPFV